MPILEIEIKIKKNLLSYIVIKYSDNSFHSIYLYLNKQQPLNLIHFSCFSIDEPCMLLNLDLTLADISCMTVTYIFNKIISVLCMDGAQ